jgi:hypothetical protein
MAPPLHVPLQASEEALVDVPLLGPGYFRSGDVARLDEDGYLYVSSILICTTIRFMLLVLSCYAPVSSVPDTSVSVPPFFRSFIVISRARARVCVCVCVCV